IEKAVRTYLSPDRVEMNRMAFLAGKQLAAGLNHCQN
ncbi:MAG: hypothetical protein ACPL7J_01490, partial [Desulfomonilaceae bacterium]